MLKTCKKCHKLKHLNEFGINRVLKDDHQSNCKVCHNKEIAKYRAKTVVMRKNRRMKNRYGISTEDWDLMYYEQKGRCLVCGIHQSELKGSLHVDHCHVTKNVRGLLCVNCNQALGSLMDNAELLRKAADYLDEHNQRP